MSVQTFRKKPVEIQAVQWTGDNEDEIQAWTGGAIGFHKIDPGEHVDNPDATAALYVAANSIWLAIETGEWVIRDSKGFYPCKADVFAASYEEV